MREFDDGIVRLRNDKGDLRIMLMEYEEPTHILVLGRNKDLILGLVKEFKHRKATGSQDETTQNIYDERISFVRAALMDCYTYDRLKFSKRNPKEPLEKPTMIDLSEFMDNLDEDSTEELL